MKATLDNLDTIIAYALAYQNFDANKLATLFTPDIIFKSECEIQNIHLSGLEAVMNHYQECFSKISKACYQLYTDIAYCDDEIAVGTFYQFTCPFSKCTMASKNVFHSFTIKGEIISSVTYIPDETIPRYNMFHCSQDIREESYPPAMQPE